MSAPEPWPALAAPAAPSSSWLSPPTVVATGVTLFTSTDPSLMTPPGPQSVRLLKLDPSVITLSSAHAGDQILGLETVDVIARRHGAIAAVNAGFFNTRNGDPAAVMKIAGELVSDATLTRGVVAIGPPQGRVPQTLTFDQLVASSLTVGEKIGKVEPVFPRLGKAETLQKLGEAQEKFAAEMACSRWARSIPSPTTTRRSGSNSGES